MMQQKKIIIWKIWRISFFYERMEHSVAITNMIIQVFLEEEITFG